MYGFTERIKSLCAEKGVTMRDVELALGFSRGYIINTGKRESIPAADRIDKLANYFGVSRSFIMGESDNTMESAPPIGCMIPLLGRVAAGVPISAVENVIGQEEISKALASTGEFFALRIKGDSMSPYIMDRDVVIVRQQPDAESGEIVIAIINEEDGCCKKLKKLDDGSIALVSLNHAYDPLIFRKGDDVQVIGKVIEIRRSI